MASIALISASIGLRQFNNQLAKILAKFISRLIEDYDLRGRLDGLIADSDLSIEKLSIVDRICRISISINIHWTPFSLSRKKWSCSQERIDHGGVLRIKTFEFRSMMDNFLSRNGKIALNRDPLQSLRSGEKLDSSRSFRNRFDRIVFARIVYTMNTHVGCLLSSCHRVNSWKWCSQGGCAVAMLHSDWPHILSTSEGVTYDELAEWAWLTSHGKQEKMRTWIADDKSIQTAVMLSSWKAKWFCTRKTDRHKRVVCPCHNLLFVF